MPDVLVLALASHDEQVQHEEARLVDIEALKELRGGPGESYRRAIKQILLAAPELLNWREIVETLALISADGILCQQDGDVRRVDGLLWLSSRPTLKQARR